jgi:hypothetical protein
MQSFNDFLGVLFQGLPGYDRIMKKEYSIDQYEKEGRLVKYAGASHPITPGAIIIMNIMIRFSYSTWDCESRSTKCPRCPGDIVRNKWDAFEPDKLISRPW